MEPFKQSSMKGYLGIRVKIKRFRKDKIVISREEILEIIADKKPETDVIDDILDGK